MLSNVVKPKSTTKMNIRMIFKWLSIFCI